MSEHETSSETLGEPTRRDFLDLATGMAGVVGAGAVAWPFIDQMRPDASTLALASIEVDVSSLQPGMSLLVIEPRYRVELDPRCAPATRRSRNRRVGRRSVRVCRAAWRP